MAGHFNLPFSEPRPRSPTRAARRQQEQLQQQLQQELEVQYQHHNQPFPPYQQQSYPVAAHDFALNQAPYNPAYASQSQSQLGSAFQSPGTIVPPMQLQPQPVSSKTQASGAAQYHGLHLPYQHNLRGPVIADIPYHTSSQLQPPAPVQQVYEQQQRIQQLSVQTPETPAFMPSPTKAPRGKKRQSQQLDSPAILHAPTPTSISTSTSTSRTDSQEKRLRARSRPQSPRKAKSRVATQPLPIEYQNLLLALADEYFEVAHARGAMLASGHNRNDMRDYYKLIATGLGCLDAVLKDLTLSPHAEALVRLKYALVLLQETDNDYDVEMTLTKGIDVCERNRMFDLKYTMQHILTRTLHKSNPRAALKAADNHIEAVDAYKHKPWQYAFRILRTNLAISSVSTTSPSSAATIASAIHNLQALTALSSRNGDKAVFTLSSLLTALVHLSCSRTPDTVEHAQREIAAARTYQSMVASRDNPSGIIPPQLNVLAQMLDIICSLLKYDVSLGMQKLLMMQQTVDRDLNSPVWKGDGSFFVPLSMEAQKGLDVVDGPILRVEKGDSETGSPDRVGLTMSWLPQHDLYALCYLLSAVTSSAKNSQDGHKAEKHLRDGLSLIKSSLQCPKGTVESIAVASERIVWRKVLQCNMLLQFVFLSCTRSKWHLAQEALSELLKVRAELESINPHCTSTEDRASNADDAFGGDALDPATIAFMQYAQGVVAQGTGAFEQALQIYASPIFNLDQFTTLKTAVHHPHRDVSILASLNTALIRHDSNINPPTSMEILSRLEDFCGSSPNKYVRTAYLIVSATTLSPSASVTPSDTTTTSISQHRPENTTTSIGTRNHLNEVVTLALQMNNLHLAGIALTFTSWRFYSGVVGEEAQRQALTAYRMTRKAGGSEDEGNVWARIAAGLVDDLKARSGNGAQERG